MYAYSHQLSNVLTEFITAYGERGKKERNKIRRVRWGNRREEKKKCRGEKERDI